MNYRKIGSRFLVANRLAPAGKYVHKLDINGFQPNDFVVYDAVTGVSLGAGDATFQATPKLGLGQVVDLDGDGVPDAIRTVLGGYLDGCNCNLNITTERPRCGSLPIEEVFFRCTYADEEYSLNVEWRNDDTLDSNNCNQWSYETLSVNLKNGFACDSCEDGVDPTRVMCALANQFKGVHIEDSNAYSFVKEAVKLQNKTSGVWIEPIFKKEVQYCISMQPGDCDSCTMMSSIKGMTIKADVEKGLAEDIVITFEGTVTSDPALSKYGQKERIMLLINRAFKENEISGYAVALDAITGDGRACCDFPILINSCYSVTLQDGNGLDIAPCVAEYDPYEGISFSNQAECVGCAEGQTFVPNAGLRAIGKPTKVECNCENPTSNKWWYHTEVRITSNQDSGFKQLFHRTRQKPEIPLNMGVQFKQMMIDQIVSGPGFDYGPGLYDNTNYWMNNNSKRLKLNSLGLKCTGSYVGISMAHALPWNVTHANYPTYQAKHNLYILIEQNNTAVMDGIKAILDPWLASLPVAHGPLNLSIDDDRVNLRLGEGGDVEQVGIDDAGRGDSTLPGSPVLDDDPIA